jgi:DNA-binding Lrp family transcriptional regulator
VSPCACLRRVQELEKHGVIAGWRAVHNPKALGIGFVDCLAIGPGAHTLPSQRGFEKAMRDAGEAKECHNVTGVVEYLARIEVADIAAYEAFPVGVLGALPQVNSIATYVMLDSPKNERG